MDKQVRGGIGDVGYCSSQNEQDDKDNDDDFLQDDFPNDGIFLQEPCDFTSKFCVVFGTW